jgi:hypothetical protein
MLSCYGADMKVHLTCSTAEFQTYRETYFGMRAFLLELGHVLTRDWMPRTEMLIKTNQVEMTNVKEIYQDNVKAIRETDLVIVEDTVSNFSTGHQITLALQQNKPTLVLWQGKKHRQFKQMFIHGIESPILEVVEYQSSDFKSVIQAFLNKFEKVHETNRFHLVLSGVERQYLDWAQFNTGKSRTQIIIKAVHDSMKKDQKYQEYLSKK